MRMIMWRAWMVLLMSVVAGQMNPSHAQEEMLLNPLQEKELGLEWSDLDAVCSTYSGMLLLADMQKKAFWTSILRSEVANPVDNLNDVKNQVVDLMVVEQIAPESAQGILARSIYVDLIRRNLDRLKDDESGMEEGIKDALRSEADEALVEGMMICTFYYRDVLTWMESQLK